MKSAFSCVTFNMLTDLGSVLRRDEGQTLSILPKRTVHS